MQQSTPRFVRDHLKRIAEGGGMSIEEVVNYHLVHSISIINAGTLLCGEPLVNPFLDFEAGLVGNYEELYLYLRQEYERFFVASKLLEEKKE